MKHIQLIHHTGSVAKNQDIAQELLIKTIIPSLNKDFKIILDFEMFNGVNYSFIHTLISDLFHKYRVFFKCGGVFAKKL